MARCTLRKMVSVWRWKKITSLHSRAWTGLVSSMCCGGRIWVTWKNSEPWRLVIAHTKREDIHSLYWCGRWHTGLGYQAVSSLHRQDQRCCRSRMVSGLAQMVRGFREIWLERGIWERAITCQLSSINKQYKSPAGVQGIYPLPRTEDTYESKYCRKTCRKSGRIKLLREPLWNQRSVDIRKRDRTIVAPLYGLYA